MIRTVAAGEVEGRRIVSYNADFLFLTPDARSRFVRTNFHTF